MNIIKTPPQLSLSKGHCLGQFGWTCGSRAEISKRERVKERGASPAALLVKNPPASAGDIRDVGLIPGPGRPPGEGNGSPLQ